jgi:hypothetical protein
MEVIGQKMLNGEYTSQLLVVNILFDKVSYPL